MCKVFTALAARARVLGVAGIVYLGSNEVNSNVVGLLPLFVVVAIVDRSLVASLSLVTVGAVR